MPDTTFQRATKRMDCLGLDLNRPVDSVKPGRFPYLKNCRSYQAGRLEPRNGLTDIGIPIPAQNEVHSMRRLNDELNATWTRIIGAGTHLATGTYAPNAFQDVDSGYSGNPLALVPWRPDQSPNAWMYVGDSKRMRKVRSDGIVDSIGYPPPLLAPRVALADDPKYRNVDEFWPGGDQGAWQIEDPTPSTNKNTATGPSGAQPAYLSQTPSGMRTLGNVQYILYDDAPAKTTGWCNVTLDIMTNPGSLINTTSGNSLPAVGQHLVLSASPVAPSPTDELAYVQGVRPGAGVASLQQTPINIAGIAYDFPGVPPCSVVLTAPVDQVDVDGLIHNIATDELARILAVIAGPDGTTSIRLETPSTWVQGQAVEILPTFRCYLKNNHGTGTIVGTDGVRFIVHALALTGTQQGQYAGNGWIDKYVDIDLSWIQPGLATQQEDFMAISVRIDHPELVTELKVQLDVDATTNDFSRNYYTRSFRPSDLTPSLNNLESTISNRQGVISNQITSNPITQATDIAGANPPAPDTQSQLLQVTTPSASDIAVSQQMETGNTVWNALGFRISDLTRVGTDDTRTLANVRRLRVLAMVTGSTNPDGTVNTLVTVDLTSWWIGGGYGPDTFDATTIPYQYRYRARNPTTGVSSNPGPVSRTGMSPRRQAIHILPEFYSPPQPTPPNAVVIDIERYGGSIAAWHYVGSVPNQGAVGIPTPPGLIDAMGDDIASTLPNLGEDKWQPWPIIDVPKSGTAVQACGTSLQDGNSTFDLRWAPGTQIGVGTNVYTIYRVISADALEVTQNMGYLSFPSWSIAEPTIQGVPLPCLWGDEQLGAFFACGDPLNPGRLYFSTGNNPDNTAEGNYLDITSPSEPLMNGVVYNLRSYVFSSERMFQILRTGNTTVPWVAQEIPNGKGLFARWAITREPAPLICILGKDGIYSTTGGAPFPLTDAELYPLLPNEGNPGEDTNGVLAPQISADTEHLLRLMYYDEFLYFDYPVVAQTGPPAPLGITTPSLPPVTVGTAYSATLQASGGTAPYTWSVSGQLPPGLSLSSAGVISGSPTTAGTYPFTISLTDSTNASVSANFTVAVSPASTPPGPPTITTTSLRAATVLVPYSQTLAASGGTPPYTWSAVTPLPAGLSLSTAGVISGTPTTATIASFTVLLVDSVSQQVSQSFQLVINTGTGAPLTITTSSLTAATVGTPYSMTMGAGGGTPPYTWSMAPLNTLPAGLTLSASGVISGTPTSAGTVNFNITVSDSGGESFTEALSLTVKPPTGVLTINTLSLLNGTAGTAYSATLSASGGVAPYNWTLLGGTLPPGLNLSTTGIISGTPTTQAVASFTVGVSDSSSQSASQVLSLTVIFTGGQLTISTLNLPGATSGVAYSFQLGVSGGVAPYTWALTAGALPAGLNLSTAGVISGTSTALGTASFTLRVSDSSVQNVSQGFTLAVSAPTSPPTITTVPTLPSGTATVEYFQQLNASGGTPPYTWSLVTALPAGLTLSSTGVLSGAPLTAGTYSFTAEVFDNVGQHATQGFQLTVNSQPVGGPLTIDTPSPVPSAIVGQPYNLTLSASGGVPPYTWSVGAVPMPPGLSLSSGGVVSGTPTTAATTSFAGVVTDSAQNVVGNLFVITIAATRAATETNPRISAPPPLALPPKPRVATGMATLILATDVGAMERGSAPGGWFWDVYQQQVLMHYGEEGPGVHAILLGGADSHLYGYSGCDDAGVPYPMEMTTPSEDGGDPRSIKLWQDIMLDINTDTLDVTVTPYVDNNKAALLSTTINTGTVRDQVSIPVGSTSPLARDSSAIEARNLSLNFVALIHDCRRPHFYIYEPRWAAAAAPLAAGSWEISATSSGLPNWKWFGIFRVSYVSAGPVDVDIWLDPGGRQPTITLPASNGDYHMEVFRVPVMKFKLWRVRVAASSAGTTETPATGTMRLDTRDSWIEIKEWGSNDAYRHFRVLDDFAMVEG